MSAPYTDPGGFSRRLLPKPSHVPSENTEEPPARKRQGVLLACDRCRKRKVKCDGQRPSCLCCLKADTECKYTTRGTALAQRYGGLQQSHSQLKLAMEVLCTGTEQDAVNALKRMREAQSHENIILGDYTTTLQRPLLFSDQGPASVTSFQERGIAHHVPAAPAFPLLEQDRPLPLSRWTTISDDDYLLTHVFKLFWTWDTTVSRLVHRDLLIKAIYSLQNGEESDGGQLNSHFCAEALINAILAYTVECFVATKEHKVQLRGCDFAKESYRTLNIRQGHETVALLQAATILSIYEHAFGDSNKGAGGFCRSLRDLGSANRLFDERSLPNNAETTSNMQPTRSFILSGLYYLNVKSCLIAGPALPMGATGRLFPTIGPEPCLNLQKLVDPLWAPYPVSTQSRLSYAYDALQIEYNLARLAAECVLATEANQGNIMPDYRGATNIYNRLLGWHEINMQRFQGPSSVIPSWVSMLVFYHWSCINLLEPFIRLPFLEFQPGKTASNLSQEHSESIILALKGYEAAFPVRHDFWLSDACGIAVRHLLLNSPSAGLHNEYLWRGCELLRRAGQYMPRSNRILLGLRDSVEERSISTSPRVKTLLNAGAVSVRSTAISNASYLSPLDNDLRITPAGKIVFKTAIEAIERPN